MYSIRFQDSSKLFELFLSQKYAFDKLVSVLQNFLHFFLLRFSYSCFNDSIFAYRVFQVIDVPREVIKAVKTKEVHQITQEVEVPGEVIEVVQKIPMKREIHVPKYEDKSVPVIVSQTHRPRISETGREVIRVEVRQFNPKVIPIDVFIPKPILRPLVAKERRDFHRIVSVPAAQQNSMVKRLNAHLLTNVEDRQAVEELYVRDLNLKAYPFLPDNQKIQFIHPVEEVGLLKSDILIGWNSVQQSRNDDDITPDQTASRNRTHWTANGLPLTSSQAPVTTLEMNLKDLSSISQASVAEQCFTSAQFLAEAVKQPRILTKCREAPLSGMVIPDDVMNSLTIAMDVDSCLSTTDVPSRPDIDVGIILQDSHDLRGMQESCDLEKTILQSSNACLEILPEGVVVPEALKIPHIPAQNSESISDSEKDVARGETDMEELHGSLQELHDSLEEPHPSERAQDTSEEDFNRELNECLLEFSKDKKVRSDQIDQDVSRGCKSTHIETNRSLGITLSLRGSVDEEPLLNWEKESSRESIVDGHVTQPHVEESVKGVNSQNYEIPRIDMPPSPLVNRYKYHL